MMCGDLEDPERDSLRAREGYRVRDRNERETFLTPQASVWRNVFPTSYRASAKLLRVCIILNTECVTRFREVISSIPQLDRKSGACQS